MFMNYMSVYHSLVTSLALVLGLVFPNDAQLIQRQPLAGWVICVDPGHGGQTLDPEFKHYYTGGAWGVWTCQTESDVNLRVGLELAQRIHELGGCAILTRDHPGRVTCDPSLVSEIDARIQVAHHCGANVLISIHHNWSPRNPCANYTSALYSRRHVYSQHLARWITLTAAREMKLPSLKPMPGSSFRILNKTDIPTVIIEASFLSNPYEDCRLANPGYNQCEAWAIARGLAYYALTHDPQSGPEVKQLKKAKRLPKAKK